MSRSRLLIAVIVLVLVPALVGAPCARAQPVDAHAAADPVTAEYLRGRDASSEGTLDEAASMFGSVVRKNEKHLVAGDASMLLLDVLNRLGAVEGLNNRLKLTFRKSYGFRTLKRTEIAIYHAVGDLHEPPTTHRFC